MRAPLLPLLVLAAACSTDGSSYAPRCDVALQTPDPSQALPGDEVTIAGSPLTTTYDTALYVGADRATVLEVTRDGCDDCDTCREDAGCSVCGDCDACDLQCTQECTETVRFEVPVDLGAGTWPVTLYNYHGVGGPVSLDVGGSGDSGTADGGATDSGNTDSGNTDSGTADGGATDSGTADGGATDSGTADGGATDSGTTG